MTDKKHITFDIETTGLNAWYGDRVTCICAKDSDGQTFSEALQGEMILIDAFLEWLDRRPPGQYTLVTCNGKHFDVPFILARLALARTLKDTYYLSILEYDHFDLAKLTSKPVSLDNLARLFGCRQKTGTGKDAIKLWEDKKLKELKSYCMTDVEVTEAVYLRLKTFLVPG